MNRRSILPLLAASLIALSGLVAAETPTANTVVDRAILAAELDSSIAEHDMLRLAIRQEETTSDGNATVRDMTALVHGAQLDNIRLDLGGGTTLVLNNSNGWAMMGGQLDTRVQTPRMAAGTIRQTLFPLLLPYSLRMQGVRLGAVAEGSFDGTPAWEIDVDFTPEFFSAPSMLTTWKVLHQPRGQPRSRRRIPPECGVHLRYRRGHSVSLSQTAGHRWPQPGDSGAARRH